MELRERVALKNSLDLKEKEHIVEVMKRNFDKKPGAQYDHKVLAMISHYE